AAVGHRQHALRVLPVLVQLVVERVAGAAAAGAARVAALQHAEVRRGGQPVARGVVEVILAGEVEEAVHGARGLRPVEREGHVAPGGGHVDVHRAGGGNLRVGGVAALVYVQSPLAAAVEALGVALGVGAAAVEPPFPPTCVTTSTTAAMTTSTPRPAAMTRLRRLRAAAAS